MGWKATRQSNVYTALDKTFNGVYNGIWAIVASRISIRQRSQNVLELLKAIITKSIGKLFDG